MAITARWGGWVDREGVVCLCDSFFFFPALILNFTSFFASLPRQILAKFRVGSLNWSWPATSINPAVNTTSYNSLLWFFNMPSYSFLTGANGYNLNQYSTTTVPYNSLPYWNV